jgi:hypothetical protein
MSRALISKISTLFAGLFMGLAVFAEDGAYSAFTPYSVYGIGNMSKPGTAFNMSMGGVGIATRNRRFVNTLNPASVTARDTLSFMADFGLSGQATSYRQGDLKSFNNILNINDFVISFPIYKSSAFMIGLTPYTNVGYKFSYIEQDPDIIGHTGTLGYSANGYGSIYQLFAGGGVTLFDNLSLGAQFIYYFGNIDKTVDLIFGDSSSRSIYSGYVLQLNGTTAKLGLQYEKPISSGHTLTLGATYKFGSKIKGHVTDFAYANLSSQTDTIRNNVSSPAENNLKFAGELGVGLSLRRAEKWSAEIDYLRSDWSGSGFDSASGFASVGVNTFSASSSQSIRAGFELTPNRNDIRYMYKRWTYRLGAYYDESYYRFNGNTVTAYGITLGMTIPVYMGYNGITVGLEFGQRGRVTDNMIRERYFGFNVGFNIFDIWFRKQRYD